MSKNRKFPNSNKNKNANRPVASSVPSGIKSTASRGSPLPKPEPRRDVTHEAIAKRAYEIYISGNGGSQLDNWLRAERELKGR